MAPGTTAAPGTTMARRDDRRQRTVEGPCPGTEGCIPANQPDVNEDGTVKIGVLSPGDTNDNGYYESFVVTANEFADAQRLGADHRRQDQPGRRPGAGRATSAGRTSTWSPSPPVSSPTPSRCAEEDVCAGTVWYVAGGAGVEQTPYFFQTNDDVFESQYAAGVRDRVW